MLIKDMFKKPIDRDIKGVIVVGEGEDSNAKQELEEYVVTRELSKHFREFFDNYKKGIVGETTKTGVWISGFFGSGKSHFLKILSYLLDGQKLIGGKRAVDYFIDDHKIEDAMVLADMKLAADTPTDVVLFNIDSKSEQTGKQSKDAIVTVFLKVFNEMQGFYGSMPYVADLERQLSEDGRYNEFKQEFAAATGKSWEDSRRKFDFIQDDIVDVLVDMDYMSEPAARNWCEKAAEPYQISIENFARMVREYIEKKGHNHHVCFLVDEVGQYIGDDSRLMLNLQTIREELGKECKGKAWVIVTSQQDVDSITQVKGNDFSKIQGRFDTRLSLSSANVDEVIKKRILAKTDTADQTLRVLYEQKATPLKNKLKFEDLPEMKLYDDTRDFVDVYPFIPYQFKLLGSVLTSIRQYGASGKHLSEGERSMLALFKESAEALQNKSDGALVPFSLFYDALDEFLDAAHRRVIMQALDNKNINPDGGDDCFAVSVLKALFLVKYVKEFQKATVTNLTTLLISDMDEDRLALTQKVQDALDVLIHETLVQKNGDVYVFLTEEEQEIGRDINRQNVEMTDIIHRTADMIYTQILTESKYKYPKFNGRYTFSYNQQVDDQPFKVNQNYDIGVRVLTPYYSDGTDEQRLRLMSGQGREVLVVLPDDREFLNEISQAMKIEKYLRTNAASQIERYEAICENKTKEMRTRLSNAKIYLVDALKSATIYVNGDIAQLSAKDVQGRIGEALARLVDTVYHKLTYIDTAFNEDDVVKEFRPNHQMSLNAVTSAEPNAPAQDDVLAYIDNNSALHANTSMKSLKDRFTKAPYGFVDDDVEWIVAHLFKKGQISLTLNGAVLTLSAANGDEIARYITKREFLDKLLTSRKEHPKPEWVRMVREIMRELFGNNAPTEDEDGLMRACRKACANLAATLANRKQYDYVKPYPGKAVIDSGLALLRPVAQWNDPMEFYKQMYQRQDDFLDFAEDYDPVKAFFAGVQKEIFDKALDLMRIYEDSKSFIVNDKVENTVKEIYAILCAAKPYQQIQKLPALLDQYNEAYVEVLEAATKPVLSTIAADRARVLEVLDEKPYKAQYVNAYAAQFDELKKKAETCNNVTILRSYADQADAVRIRLLNEMDKRDEKLTPPTPPTPPTGGDDPVIPQPPKPQPKRRKNLAIKSLTQTTSWRIESDADIDAYLAALRRRLESELDPDTIVNVEF